MIQVNYNERNNKGSNKNIQLVEEVKRDDVVK